MLYARAGLIRAIFRSDQRVEQFLALLAGYVGFSPVLEQNYRLRYINSLNPTGISLLFIVNLALAQLLPGGLIRALYAPEAAT